MRNNNLSSATKVSVSTLMENNGKYNDVKQKLAYEWKNIFRAITQADPERRGLVPISVLNQAAH
jgi:hypothetical protein